MKKISLCLLQLFVVAIFYSQTNIFPSTGSAGIGTTSPMSPFTIRTTLSQGATIFDFGNPQQYNQILFKDRDFSSFLFGIQSNQIKIGTSGNDHKIMSIQYNAQNIELWPTVALNSPSNILINAGGNVGIGNTNPQYKLDVTGDARVSGNILAGGGIITTSTLNSSGKIIAGDIDVSNNLNVVGSIHATGSTVLNGSLRLPGLGNGFGNQPVVIDGFGNIIVSGTACIDPASGHNSCNQCSVPWLIGGNGVVGSGYNDISVGTCDNADFILKSNGINRQWLHTDGTIGFGTNIVSNTFGPEYRFKTGVIRLQNTNTYGGPQVVFDFDNNSTPYGDWGIEYSKALTKPGLNFWKPFGSTNSGNDFLFLADDGLVGIGTDNPTYKLTIDAWSSDGVKIFTDPNKVVIDVFNKTTLKTEFKVKANGFVYAREINVMPANIVFPDYVFESDYKKPELLDLENYIKQNKHLPNIPSAKEVEKEGINLAEMQVKQMEKIEEAFLYIIELKKENDDLKERIKKLEDHN